GEILRLSQRSDRTRTGEGSVTLAVAQPPDALKQIFEIRPGEKGIIARDPDIAVSPTGEMAIVYRWWQNQPRRKEIRLARSSDGGKTWTQSATPVDTAGKAFDGSAAILRDRSLVVVWSDERRGSRAFDIYARRSPDGGVTWEDEQLLSRFPKPLMSETFARPRMIDD